MQDKSVSRNASGRSANAVSSDLVLIATLVGLLQGGVGWAVNSQWSAVVAEQAIWLGIFDAVLVGGLCLQLLSGRRIDLRESLQAIATALLFGVTTWWSVQQMAVNDTRYEGDGFFSMCIFLLILAYVLIPYLQSWHSRSEGRFVYHELYRHSWDNFFIVFIGLLLTGIFWLLIALWAALFDMLHIRFFSDIFYSKPFGWLSSFVVTGFGITIGIRNDAIIGTLRNIALAICRFMMPLTAIITLLFTMTLPFTGLKPVWDTNHASPILLCLIAANVFFLNGIYQDGEKVSCASPLRALFSLSLCVLPVLALLAAYSTWLRIDQYGYTPSRIYSALIILVGACYSVGYCWCVIRRQSPWLSGMRGINVNTGLLICGLVVITHSPLFDPLELSARNQYQRLLSGRASVEEFDFGSLKYRLGKPGQRYLRQIRALQQHPQLALIKARLAALDDGTISYEEWRDAWRKSSAGNSPTKDATVAPLVYESTNNRPEMLGGGEVPTGFLDVLPGRVCLQRCYLIKVDVDRDGYPELVKFEEQDSVNTMDVYTNKSGDWAKAGVYRNVESGRYPRGTDLIKDYSQQGVKLEEPAVQDLRIGPNRWDFLRD